MPRYRVEIGALALGWLGDIEADNEEEAAKIALDEWQSADFDEYSSPSIEGVYADEEAE